MKYYIRRDLNEYGPYTLADLQRYVAQGNIQLTDLTRSEGMTDWVPVSQVIGNIPAPSAVVGTVYAGGNAYGGSTVYGGGGTVYGGTPAGYGTAAAPATYATAVPVDFHWGLVLPLSIFSCGLFFWAWLIVEASWVRKIHAESKALHLAVAAVGCVVLNWFVAILTGVIYHSPVPTGILFLVAEIACYLISVFMMQSELQEYYNSVEPINLRLSGVMTFFFAVFYFQHHLSRISKWKKTGILQPQS